MQKKKSSGIPSILTKFFDRISSKPRVGGLHITNGGLQYVFSEGKQPKTAALKLPPDVIKEGKLQKKDEFIAVAKKLYEMIDVERKKDPIQIVVSIPALGVYTQSFSVPNIDREKLEESAALNLQMLSPVPKEQAYMSYQIINETPDKYDLLGAFVEKKIIDDFRLALQEANFFCIAFEFPSLSLTRLVSRSLSASEHPILVMYVSGDGIDFFILRGGFLLFDYFRSWQSIQGNETAIQKDLFLQTAVTETQKVSNFILSRYKERIESIYLVTPAFEAEIQEALKTSINIVASPLLFPGIKIPSPWYVALGSSFRDFRREDSHAINLNFESAGDIFFEQHALSFLFFWRRLAVVLSVVFIAVFLVTYSFLNEQLAALKQQFDASRVQANARELSVFKAQATEFNALVAELGREPRKIKEWEYFFSSLNAVMKKNNVTPERLGVVSFSSPITMNAKTIDTASTLAFKNTLARTRGFSQVEVPLLSIRELEDGTVGFTITFSVNIEELLQDK